MQKWAKHLLISLSIVAVVAGSIFTRPFLFPGGLGLESSTTTVTKIERTLAGGEVKQVITTTNPGKTVWDWASLVGVPLSLFALGYWVQKTQQQQAAALASEQQTLSEIVDD